MGFSWQRTRISIPPAEPGFPGSGVRTGAESQWARARSLTGFNVLNLQDQCPVPLNAIRIFVPAPFLCCFHQACLLSLSSPYISIFNLQITEHFALCCCPSDTAAAVFLAQLCESASNSFLCISHNIQGAAFPHFYIYIPSLINV